MSPFPIKFGTGRDGESQPKRSVYAQCPGGVSFVATETSIPCPSGPLVCEKLFFFFHFCTMISKNFSKLPSPKASSKMEERQLFNFRIHFVDLRYSLSAGEK